MTLERDNLKAGLFVLTGIILILFVVFTLADIERLFEKTQSVIVAYKLSDGLKGLKTGASVTLGDEPVGEVVALEDQYEQAAGRVIGKLITVEIPKHITICQNAVFQLVVPTLGSGTRLNIRSVGVGAKYDLNTHIEGTIASNELVKHVVHDAGIGDKQRTEIQTVIENIAAITTTLRDDIPGMTESLKQIIIDGKSAITDLKQAAREIRQVMATINERKDSWLDRLDTITESTAEAASRFKRILKDKDTAIRQVVDNTRDITQTLNDKTLVQVDEALAKAAAALSDVKESSAQVRALIIGQRPVLERAVANAQLTTDQLKLAAIEIRRSPWRLLYKPGNKELETDNLYDAARSFALAASALEAGAQSLQSMAHNQPYGSPQIAKMLDHLESLFGRFTDAEDAFWNALKGHIHLAP